MNWGGRLGGHEGKLGMLAEKAEGGGGNQVQEQGFGRNLKSESWGPVNVNRHWK